MAKFDIEVNVITSSNVKDAIILIPADELHPLNFAARNDALKLDVDTEKIPGDIMDEYLKKIEEE